MDPHSHLTALYRRRRVARGRAPPLWPNTSLVRRFGWNADGEHPPARLRCTYVNDHHGSRSTRSVSTRHARHRRDAGSVGGEGQLRRLGRPDTESSGSCTPAPGRPSVWWGDTSRAISCEGRDVLAPTNDTSGIDMASASSGTCVRYSDSSVPTDRPASRTRSRHSFTCCSAPTSRAETATRSEPRSLARSRGSGAFRAEDLEVTLQLLAGAEAPFNQMRMPRHRSPWREGRPLSL